jgi:hypothetical protein
MSLSCEPAFGIEAYLLRARNVNFEIAANDYDFGLAPPGGQVIKSKPSR